jgi:hypothetical protein
VQIGLSGQVRVSASREYGQVMTRDEDDVVSKSIRLGPEAPPPAAVAMTESAETRVLVASVDLEHRARP